MGMGVGLPSESSVGWWWLELRWGQSLGQAQEEEQGSDQIQH